MNISKNSVNEEVFKSVIENSTDLTIITDAEGVAVYVSPQCKDVIGYAKKDILGKGMPDFIHPDDREKCREAWNRVMAGKSLRKFKYRILDKKGKERWLSHSAKYVTAGKENVGMQNIMRDITGRKQVEEALRESENTLKEEQRIANMGSWNWDLKTNKVIWSDNLCLMHGMKPGEFDGQFDTSMSFFHPDDLAFIQKKMQQLMDEKKTMEFEYRIITRDGVVKVIRGDQHMFFDDEGNIVRMIGILQDVTERKKAQDELEKAQKLESLGTLAAGIAHDFNNMLGSFFGYVDMAREHAAGDQKLTYYLERAMTAYAVAKDLTRQLLTFSKGGGPNKSVVSVRAILHETEHMALSGSNIRCEHTTTKKLHLIEADKGQLTQVFTNILLNSRQAMPDGGTITMKCSNRELKNNQVTDLPDGLYVQIGIKDSGVGIPKEMLPKVFDPFFTTKQLGSGLGLATTYSIIKKHNGHIAIDSELGVGTTITILLPVTDEKLSEEHDKPLPVLKSTGRILVMDDDEMLLGVAGEHLKSLGYSFECAGNGEEAVKLYKMSIKEKKKFDAVIMDLTVVGGMGGVATIRNLLEIDPEVKGIVSSGYSDDPVLAEPGKYGFLGKIAKPYLKKELAAVLNDVIRGK